MRGQLSRLVVNFGLIQGAALSATVVVPEPSAAVLILMATLATLSVVNSRRPTRSKLR